MKLSQIYGHTKQKTSLIEAVLHGTWHSSYLFFGKEGIGKYHLARSLSRYLTCSNRGVVSECGICPSCLQKEQDSHPDEVIVKPDGSMIKIDQIRETIQFLSLKSFSNNEKVLIVDDAERMNVQSQNCFLKTLEEPPKRTMIILVASDIQAMLATIRSRCQKIHFISPNLNEAKQAFSGREVSEERIELLYHAAEGRIAQMLRLIEDDGYFKLREGVLDRLIRSDDVFETAKWLSEQKDGQDDIHGLFGAFIHDLFISQHGKGEVSLFDYREKIAAVAAAMDPRKLEKICDQYFVLMEKRKTNCNSRLVFEQFLMTFL